MDVCQWYWKNGKNLYQTCKRYDLNTKTVLRWIKKISKSQKGHKHVQFKRTSHYPGVEDSLYKEYRSLRQQGLKVNPDADFEFSNGWFDGFKQCLNISLRRPTNKAQHTPLDKRQLIRRFHQEIRQEVKSGSR